MRRLKQKTKQRKMHLTTKSTRADAPERVCVLFIGAQFSNLYTAVDTPARGRVDAPVGRKGGGSVGMWKLS